MDRVTNKMLEYLCDRINVVTKSPRTAWSRDEFGNMRANIGNYHISGAYGGVCLHRMMNAGGGVNTPLAYGHVPKRELYNAMRAFLQGLEERLYHAKVG